MRHDLISDMLSILKNNDNVGKTEAITPASSLIKEALMIIQREKYIGNFEFVDDKKGGKFSVKLIGVINNCGSIRPRSSVKIEDFKKWERRFLPAAEIGILIVSTSRGLMTHKEAIKEKIGGKLLAYVY